MLPHAMTIISPQPQGEQGCRAAEVDRVHPAGAAAEEAAGGGAGAAQEGGHCTPDHARELRAACQDAPVADSRQGEDLRAERGQVPGVPAPHGQAIRFLQRAGNEKKNPIFAISFSFEPEATCNCLLLFLGGNICSVSPRLENLRYLSCRALE